MATVLIVEDDPNTRRFTSINLSMRGHCVIEAADGNEGEEKLLRHLPDVVVLDIRLPEKSGLEILERMAQDTRLCRIPVIIMTASHLNLIDDDGHNRHMVSDVLIKPFRPAALLDAVAKALRSQPTLSADSS
jgi:DNA-binding response OmpR family regulator